MRDNIPAIPGTDSDSIESAEKEIDGLDLMVLGPLWERVQRKGSDLDFDSVVSWSLRNIHPGHGHRQPYRGGPQCPADRPIHHEGP